MSTYDIEDEKEEAPNFDTHAEEAAALKGMDVLLPNSDQLFLDLDTEEAWKRFNLWAPRIFMDIPTIVDEWPSVSGLPHRHIKITVPGRFFDHWQRVAIQAALGSDLNREALSCRTMMNGTGNIRPASLSQPLPSS